MAHSIFKIGMARILARVAEQVGRLGLIHKAALVKVDNFLDFWLIRVHFHLFIVPFWSCSPPIPSSIQGLQL